MNSIMDILNIPFGYVLRFCNFIGFGNYVLALLIFAIIMKVILFPLGIRQQKNMVKQASLRPKEMAIRKRYQGRTDRVTMQKMQTEIQEMYQKENFSPFGGCLPLLLQFPIIIALYNVIRNPLQYLLRVSTDNIAKVKEIYMAATGSERVNYDLEMLSEIKSHFSDYQSALGGVAESDLPNFEIFPGFDLSGTPAFWNWLLVIVVLCFATQFLSMRLSRKFSYQAPQTGDAAKSMIIMDLLMPLMTAWIAMRMPAVIGLYWVYQNILGVAQQFILSKMFPYPTFTEEEMKAIEKKMNSSSGNNVRRETVRNPNVRSLHHIDDDDEPYADVPDRADEEDDAPSAKTNAVTDGAPKLKEDRPKDGDGKSKKGKTGKKSK